MIIWTPGMTLEETEKQIVNKAFYHFNKDAMRTANALNISLEDFQKKQTKYAKQEIEKQELRKINDEKSHEFNLRARGMAKPIMDDISHQNILTEEIQRKSFATKSTLKKAELS